MGDDYIDEVGVALDADWGDSAGACGVCGSTRCIPNDIGELVCVDCGTQSQDVRQLVMEAATEAAEMDHIVKTSFKRRFKAATGRSLAAVPHATDAFTTADFALAMQIVLQAQVHALISHCGSPAELQTVVVQLWRRYLARWSHCGAPLGHVVHGEFRYGTMPPYLAKLYADGQAPPAVLPLTMPLLLSLLLISCRWLRLPFMAHDLCLWARNGTLPYLNAFRLLPPGLQLTVTAAHGVLQPSELPRPARIAVGASLLALNIGVPLPDANIHAAILRVAARGCFPPGAAAAAQQIASLDEVDRAHAPAYLLQARGMWPASSLPTSSSSGSSSSSSRGGGSKSTSAGTGASAVAVRGASSVRPARVRPRATIRKDVLSELRVSLDFSSGAYVAALLVMGMRLSEGWEEWTARFLAPGFVGDGGAALAGLRAQAAAASAAAVGLPRDSGAAAAAGSAALLFDPDEEVPWSGVVLREQLHRNVLASASTTDGIAAGAVSALPSRTASTTNVADAIGALTNVGALTAPAAAKATRAPAAAVALGQTARQLHVLRASGALHGGDLPLYSNGGNPGAAAMSQHHHDGDAHPASGTASSDSASVAHAESPTAAVTAAASTGGERSDADLLGFSTYASIEQVICSMHSLDSTASAGAAAAAGAGTAHASNSADAPLLPPGTTDDVPYGAKAVGIARMSEDSAGSELADAAAARRDRDTSRAARAAAGGSAAEADLRDDYMSFLLGTQTSAAPVPASSQPSRQHSQVLSQASGYGGGYNSAYGGSASAAYSQDGFYSAGGGRVSQRAHSGAASAVTAAGMTGGKRGRGTLAANAVEAGTSSSQGVSAKRARPAPAALPTAEDACWAAAFAESDSEGESDEALPIASQSNGASRGASASTALAGKRIGSAGAPGHGGAGKKSSASARCASDRPAAASLSVLQTQAVNVAGLGAGFAAAAADRELAALPGVEPLPLGSVEAVVRKGARDRQPGAKMRERALWHATQLPAVDAASRAFSDLALQATAVAGDGEATSRATHRDAALDGSPAVRKNGSAAGDDERGDDHSGSDSSSSSDSDSSSTSGDAGSDSDDPVARQEGNARAAAPVLSATAAAALCASRRYLSFPPTALPLLAAGVKPLDIVDNLSASDLDVTLASYPAALRALLLEAARLTDAPVGDVIVHMEALELMLISYVPLPMRRVRVRVRRAKQAQSGGGEKSSGGADAAGVTDADAEVTAAAGSDVGSKHESRYHYEYVTVAGAGHGRYALPRGVVTASTKVVAAASRLVQSAALLQAPLPLEERRAGRSAASLRRAMSRWRKQTASDWASATRQMLRSSSSVASSLGMTSSSATSSSVALPQAAAAASSAGASAGARA